MPSPTSLIELRKALGDRYAIEDELGRGGMGAVYRARDLRLDRPVALKVLPAEFANDPTLRERFLRETRTAASFSHPNIIPVHAIEERDGILAFAMGFVEGETVAQRVRRGGPLGVRELVRLLQDVGYALAYAHGRGVVHRDIKPDNIMLERATGRALLMDFGIARTVLSTSVAEGLTRVGESVGTPQYMSPEQAVGDNLDGRSDIYSLGLVAWYAVTGTAAITGDNTAQILARQLTEVLPPVESQRPEIPAALALAINRCVLKAPDARFATAEALVEAIDDARLTQPEIPLPIRMFTQELGTLSLVVGFVVATSWLVFGALGENVSSLDAALPAVILFAVALTRVLQTLASARRLALAGFRSGEVLQGMRAIVDEFDQQRTFLGANDSARKMRRKSLLIALPQVPVALLLIWMAWRSRIPVGVNRYTTPAWGIVMVLTALALLGVVFAIVVRSPFRMPLGERLFRAIWLGAFGRGFLRLAGRRLTPATPTSNTPMRPGPVSSPARTTPPLPKYDSHGLTELPDPVARLERRVASLEAWRESRP